VNFTSHARTYTEHMTSRKNDVYSLQSFPERRQTRTRGSPGNVFSQVHTYCGDAAKRKRAADEGVRGRGSERQEETSTKIWRDAGDLIQSDNQMKNEAALIGHRCPKRLDTKDIGPYRNSNDEIALLLPRLFGCRSQKNFSLSRCTDPSPPTQERHMGSGGYREDGGLLI
jgi:hypothetical protein